MPLASQVRRQLSHVLCDLHCSGPVPRSGTLGQLLLLLTLHVYLPRHTDDLAPASDVMLHHVLPAVLHVLMSCGGSAGSRYLEALRL